VVAIFLTALEGSQSPVCKVPAAQPEAGMHVAQSARALFENSLLLGSTGFPRGTPDSAPVPLTQPFSFNGAMSICFTPYTPSIARGEPCAGRSQPLRCTGSTEAVRPMT